MVDSRKTIIIKVGSSLLTSQTQRLNREWMVSLADDMAALRRDGTRLVLVSSGAVALGRGLISIPDKGMQLSHKQAAAACGQPLLMSAWSDAFAPHEITIAQILLTVRESEDRRSFLNARNTLLTLLDEGVIPIVNENDSTVTAGVRYGDNDRLSARIAQMVNADSLVLLSDVKGLYTHNPTTHAEAKFLSRIDAITPEIERMAGPSASDVGTGGMVTKIAAAKMATQSACDTIIANGHGLNPLAQLADVSNFTTFHADGTPLSAWKQWISGSIDPAGAVVVDDGAEQALRCGKSLLHVGVVAIEGAFQKGDTIAIYSQNRQLIAKGLSHCDDHEAQAMLGKRSEQIESPNAPISLIHRNNLVMMS